MSESLTWLLAQTTQNNGLVLKLGAKGGLCACVGGGTDASVAGGICEDIVATAFANGCGGVTECDPGFEVIPLFGVGVCNCWRCCCCWSLGSARAKRGSRTRLGSMLYIKSRQDTFTPTFIEVQRCISAVSRTSMVFSPTLQCRASSTDNCAQELYKGSIQIPL